MIKNKKSKKNQSGQILPTSDKSFDQTFAAEGWKSLGLIV